MRTTGLARALQLVVGLFGALLFISGVALIFGGLAGPGAMLLLLGAGALLVSLYEVTRYRGRVDEPGGTGAEPVSWGHPAADGAGTLSRLQPTGEVFHDPTTGDRVRVWHDPATGERRYVPEPRV